MWHLKSTLIPMCVHVDEAVMGLSVHTNGDGAGENPLLDCNYREAAPAAPLVATPAANQQHNDHSGWSVCAAAFMAADHTACGPTSSIRTMSARIATTAAIKTMAVATLVSPIPPPFGPPKKGHLDASPLLSPKRRGAGALWQRDLIALRTAIETAPE